MFSSQEIDLFSRICSSFGIDLSEEMVDKFKDYTTLLLEWNQRMHLVSRRDAEPYRILRHFVDSLCIFKAVAIPKGANLLDLGSGAGFPGVPIKIVRDDIRLTLVESIRKKTLFLRKLSDSLGFEKVVIVNRRAEELAEGPGFRGKFNLVTAKALGGLKETVESSVPLLVAGGVLTAYKGSKAKAEIKTAFSPTDSLAKNVVKVEVPEMDLVLWIVVVRKEE
jgi:16S rRNA (guanine527-N7)-methyltransferase